MNIRARQVGFLGLLSVLILIVSLIVFGFANDEFSFIHDFISKIGSVGAPNALWFNLIGFMTVGVLLFAFGWSYGILCDDRLISILLSLFGLGFACTAFPMNMEISDSAVSKAHIVAICLGLASWMLGLARLGSKKQLNLGTKRRANVFALLLAISMMGFPLGLWSMPTTHRLVFGIVFGWTSITSLALIYRGGHSESHTVNNKANKINIDLR